MSNSTTSPNSLSPASKAKVPPIWPAPISAILLRAIACPRLGRARDAGGLTAKPECRQGEPWSNPTALHWFGLAPILRPHAFRKCRNEQDAVYPECRHPHAGRLAVARQCAVVRGRLDGGAGRIRAAD